MVLTRLASRSCFAKLNFNSTLLHFTSSTLRTSGNLNFWNESKSGIYQFSAAILIFLRGCSNLFSIKFINIKSLNTLDSELKDFKFQKASLHVSDNYHDDFESLALTIFIENILFIRFNANCLLFSNRSHKKFQYWTIFFLLKQTRELILPHFHGLMNANIAISHYFINYHPVKRDVIL